MKKTMCARSHLLQKGDKVYSVGTVVAPAENPDGPFVAETEDGNLYAVDDSYDNSYAWYLEREIEEPRTTFELESWGGRKLTLEAYVDNEGDGYDLQLSMCDPHDGNRVDTSLFNIAEIREALDSIEKSYER